jgi:hypothetical protein
MTSEVAEGIAKLPGTLFSPAKMVYIAYVILTGLGRLAAQPLWIFFLVSLVFLLVEIGHNDWLRIILNNHAERNRQVS